jgi:hypothetical protein
MPNPLACKAAPSRAPAGGRDTVSMTNSFISVDRLDKAGEYRQRAQEIRTIVQKISINDVREQLLETAERFERLAQDEERKAHAPGAKPEPQSEA